MIYQIITEGDPRLTAPNADITEITDEVRDLIADMKQTLIEANSTGLGLAAPQIGVNLNVIVLRQSLDNKVTKLQDKPLIAMINPVVVKAYPKTVTYREGCLSVIDKHCDVKRSKDIKVRYMDEFGKTSTVRITNTDAVVAQHEIDHLNGILMTTSPNMLYTHFVNAKTETLPESEQQEA